MRGYRRVFLAAVVGVAVGLLAGIGAERSADRRHIMLPRPFEGLPFSNGVLVGDTLYLAGSMGIDPETGKPPADISDEARLALEDMKATLAQADMTMDDLVVVQVFCTDVALYDQFNQVYRTYFSEEFPARAFIGAGRLLFGGHFEVNGIAVRRPQYSK